MKKIRFIAIAAVVAACGLAVGNANASKSRVPQTWVRLASANPDLAASYIPDNGSACSGSAFICKIVDEPNGAGTQPALTFGAVTTHQTQYQATKRASN